LIKKKELQYDIKDYKKKKELNNQMMMLSTWYISTWYTNKKDKKKGFLNGIWNFQKMKILMVKLI